MTYMYEPDFFILFLDWLDITLSFFNTITLLWLGMTVLLNTDRRRWGTWVGGYGLIAGGVFFIGHTILVGRVIGTYNNEMSFWWRIGWLPFIGLPYLWYMLMVWYTGVLHKSHHKTVLLAMSIIGLGAIALLVLASPIPSWRMVLTGSPSAISTIGDIIPMVGLVYPVYSTLCIVLSLVALQQQKPSQQFMVDVARRRARPWLIAASLVLLGISLSFSATIAWFLYMLQSGQLPRFSLEWLVLMIAFDLFISGLVAIVVVCIGEAVVSYEILTGKAIPRGGLRRYWRSTLLFAAAFSGLVAWSLGNTVHMVYILLLITVAVTLRNAIFCWRSFIEREESMNRLRPFVTSERIYDRLTTSLSTSLPEIDITRPLRALCDDVLDAEVAYLAPLGSLAPLIGPALVYSVNGRDAQGVRQVDDLPPLGELSTQFHSLQTMCIAIDPSKYGGAVWAVPLWSERGLIGVLLLGNKREGGLYTLEEIEIARATGERLIDTLASVEMARRLMSLQRQRLSDSQVLDRRTRRVLHDDVLPQLHTSMIMLSGEKPSPSITGAVEVLTGAHRQISDLLHAMPATSSSDVARLGLIGALQQVVEHELGASFDSVVWQLEPEVEQKAHDIPSLTAEVIFYAARESMRNAARYGRGDTSDRALKLTIVAHWRNGLVLTIEDDGVGMDGGNKSLSSEGGSGHGLALHSTMMAVIGGTLTVESAPTRYTRVVLWLPA